MSESKLLKQEESREQDPSGNSDTAGRRPSQEEGRRPVQPEDETRRRNEKARALRSKNKLRARR